MRGYSKLASEDVFVNGEGMSDMESQCWVDKLGFFG